MAGVINKIRTKGSMILLIFIGVAMLSFVLTDILSNVNSIFRGNSANALGVVSGEEIDFNTFKGRVDQETALAQLNQQQQGNNQPIDQNRVSNDVWQRMVNETIYGKQYESLGITVSKEEFSDMLTGPDPDPEAKQMFGDEAQIRQVLTQSEKDPNLKFRVTMAEKYLIDSKMRRKFETLVKGGIFVSKSEALRKHREENTNYSFEYLAVNYAAIADSTVKVTDADYAKFYQDHIEEFRQNQPQTFVQFVNIPKVATRQDSAAARRYLEDLVNEFKTIQSDSSYAASKNRSIQGFPYDFQQRGELDPETVMRIEGVSEDSVIGPFLSGNMYKLIKLTDVTRRDTAPFIKFRHIFIQPKGNTAQDTFQAQMQAQIQTSMITADNFAQYVQSLSDDNQTKQQGGEVGWYRYGMFGKKFDAEVKKLQAGQIAAVNSDFGSHIVEIQQKSAEGIRIATIGNDILPSQHTMDSLMSIAETFRASVNDTASFNKEAAKRNLQVTQSQAVQAGSSFIGGISGTGSKEVVVWALSAEQDELPKNAFDTENAIVVPIVVSKVDKGYQPLESIKEKIKPRVLAQMKGEMIMKRFSQAVKDKSDLEQMRNQYGAGAFTNKAENITFASGYIPGIGQDPILIGALPGLKINAASKPIQGKTGVFVIKVSSVAPAEKLEGPALEEYRISQQQNKRNAFVSKVQEGLKNQADIVDRRYVFNY